MKKFLIATLIVITMSTAAFGAASGDVYLRQDVFEAKMEALDAKMNAFIAEIRLMNERTRSELIEKIQDTKTELNEKIQEVKAEVKVTNSRVDWLLTLIYWGIGIITFLVSAYAWGPSILQKFKDLRSRSMLEDVERLIDAKLQAKNQ